MDRDVNLEIDQLCQGMGKIETRFVRDIIIGIRKSKSVRLSRISEALDEDIELHATHKRLSRNLADRTLGKTVSENVLQLSAGKVHHNTRIILDQFNIKKKYATKMQYIENLEKQPTANTNGYHACEILSSDIEPHTFRPMALSLWSHNAPGFESDNVELLTLVEKVRHATQGKGILVVNAGLGNNGALLNPWTIDESCRYIVRLFSRHPLVYKNRTVSAEQLADACKTPYGRTIFSYVDGKEFQYFIHYGFLPVRLPAAPERPLWLVVVKGYGATYLLLTTEPMRRNQKLLKSTIEAYLTRSQVIHTNHFTKREIEFDDMRVLSYDRVKNLAILMQASNYCHTSDEGLPVHEVGLSFEHKSHSPPLVPRIKGIPVGLGPPFSRLAAN